MLGCAVGSIYRYYKDKTQLLLDVTQQPLLPVAASLEAGTSFEQSILQYVRVAQDQVESYQLLFWLNCEEHQRRSAPAVGSRLPDVVERIVAGWSRMVGDPLLARRILATVHGSVTLGLASDQILAALDSVSPAWANETTSASGAAPLANLGTGAEQTPTQPVAQRAEASRSNRANVFNIAMPDESDDAKAPAPQPASSQIATPSPADDKRNRPIALPQPVVVTVMTEPPTPTPVLAGNQDSAEIAAATASRTNEDVTLL